MLGRSIWCGPRRENFTSALLRMAELTGVATLDIELCPARRGRESEEQNEGVPGWCISVSIAWGWERSGAAVRYSLRAKNLVPSLFLKWMYLALT